MAKLDILCFTLFNLKKKIMKIEHKKIFRGRQKILKNISWSVNICLKYFMVPTKTLRSPPPSYILNVRSLFHVSQDSCFSDSRFFSVQIFQGPGFSESRFLRVRVQVLEEAVKSNPFDLIRELWLNYKTFHLFITKELIDYYNLVIVRK